MYDVEAKPVYDKGWFLELYSYNDETGEPIVGDTDGDWESIDEYPEPEEIIGAWMDYYRWVADTGEDPLGDLPSSKSRSVNATYQFKVALSLLGVLLLAWREGRRGAWNEPDSAPEVLRQWLLIDPKAKHNRLVIAKEDIGSGAHKMERFLELIEASPDAEYNERSGIVTLKVMATEMLAASKATVKKQARARMLQLQI